MNLSHPQLLHESRFTRVYRALLDDRAVCVKRATSDAKVLEKEAEALAVISHPAIPPLIDLGQDSDGARLVREWVNGVSLADRLAQGPFVEAQAERLLMAVTDALQAVHRAGWLHGDLVANNVLIREGTDCDVALIDFANAQRQAEARPSMVGTIGSMAPELFDGALMSVATDLYALGVIGYQLLTGQLPFDGEHPAQIIAAQHRREVPPLPATISEAFRARVIKLLHRDPAQRA